MSFGQVPWGNPGDCGPRIGKTAPCVQMIWLMSLGSFQKHSELPRPGSVSRRSTFSSVILQTGPASFLASLALYLFQIINALFEKEHVGLGRKNSWIVVMTKTWMEHSPGFKRENQYWVSPNTIPPDMQVPRTWQFNHRLVQPWPEKKRPIPFGLFLLLEDSLFSASTSFLGIPSSPYWHEIPFKADFTRGWLTVEGSFFAFETFFA